MLSYVLFVGSEDHYLAESARDYNPSATLLTTIPSKGGVYYTSLPDMDTSSNFVKVCQEASEVFYCPPKSWNSELQRVWTEEAVLMATQTTIVHEHINRTHNFLKGDIVSNKRENDGPQIWAVGCSITVGVGVDRDACWKTIVQKHFDMPMQSVCKSGSSILWQGDQIIRSDLKEGDIVCWAVTHNNRIPIIVDGELLHLSAGSYQKSTRKNIAHVPPEILQSDTLMFHNVQCIRQVTNVCRMVKAKLVMVGTLFSQPLLFPYLGDTGFRQSVAGSTMLIDTGTDGAHPGPLQHVKYAQDFIDTYNKLYA